MCKVKCYISLSRSALCSESVQFLISQEIYPHDLEGYGGITRRKSNLFREKDSNAYRQRI